MNDKKEGIEDKTTDKKSGEEKPSEDKKVESTEDKKQDEEKICVDRGEVCSKYSRAEDACAT